MTPAQARRARKKDNRLRKQRTTEATQLADYFAALDFVRAVRTQGTGTDEEITDEA